MCIFTCMHVCDCGHAIIHRWKSKDSTGESLLYFCYVCATDWTQFSRLGNKHLHTVSYCPGSVSISLYPSTLFSPFSFSFFLSLSDLVLCLEQKQNDHPQQNPLCLWVSIYIAESNVIVYRLCAHCQTYVTDVETSINQVTITDFCSMWSSCSLIRDYIWDKIFIKE